MKHYFINNRMFCIILINLFSNWYHKFILVSPFRRREFHIDKLDIFVVIIYFDIFRIWKRWQYETIIYVIYSTFSPMHLRINGQCQTITH